MDKVLICLYVPVLKEQYDLFAPRDVPIAELAALLARGVAELSSGQYCVSGDELLSALHPDILLDPRKTLRDYSVLDGTEMMLL